MDLTKGIGNRSIGKIFLLAMMILLSLRSFSQDSTISHYVTFETDQPQNMWGPGTGWDINRTIELFPKFHQEFSFDTRAGSIFKFGGLKFGAGLYGGFLFDLGPLDFRISGFEAGHVSVKYPIKVDLSFPRDSSFNAGEIITIKSDYTVEPGYELNTFYPEAGEIALEMPIVFDVKVGMEFCLFDCFDYYLFPPVGPATTLLPDTLVNFNWIIFGVNADEITYPCANFPPVCTQDIDLALPGGTPLSGSLKIPHVTTTASLDGKDLVAEGSDVYVDASLDIMQLLSYTPPPVGTFFTAMSSGISLPPGGIPDFGGTKRYVDVTWTIFSMHLGFPLSQNQSFRFSPDVNLKLDFPVELEYIIEDHVMGTSVSSTGSTVQLPVGADLSVRYPCDYAYMDFEASYTIENEFTNRTYDHVDIELIFQALEFGIEFPDFDIIPRTCISIPLVGKICVELTLPGFSIPIGPLIAPAPIHLAGFDFPDYVNRTWELGGFSEIPIADPFRITPRKFRINSIVTNSNCYGEASGGASVNVTGATSPLTYSWSNGTQTQNLTNALAGKHYVSVTDVNGCRSIATIEITEPPEIQTSISGTNLICHADNSGTASVTVTGGVPGYSFAWNSNPSTSSTATGLLAGLHKVTVTDLNGCQKEDSVSLTEPRPINSAILKAGNPTCEGKDDGEILIDVSGGTEPYAYAWSNGASDQDVTDLREGSYTVQITDQKGCGSTLGPINLLDPPALNVSLNVNRNVSCFAGSDGEIEANVSGGTTPYNFRWLNNFITLSQKSNILKNVTASNYTLELEDKNGCKTSKMIEVTQPSSRLEVTLSSTDATCFGTSSGSLSAIVTGGTPPYSGLWSNGINGLMANNLSAGKYSVTIADANGCTIATNGIIVQPSRINIFPSVTDVSCSDQVDGKIQLQISGGSAPYTYNWSTGSTDSVVTNLAEGFYSVTVTDQQGCSEFSSMEIKKNEGKCLFIPNAFSPDGDGINDTWVIRNIHLYPNSKVEVYNKWGQLVYSASPYINYWNGTFNGTLLPSATYYYVVDLGNGEEKYTGPLTIVKQVRE